MKSVHIVLQCQGSIGKSFVSSMLCQYFRDYLGKTIVALDTDDVNPTLVRYKHLPVRLVKIYDGNDPDPRKLDTIAEIVEDAGNGCHIIIDNGIGTFRVFHDWLLESRIIHNWIDTGIRVLLHVMIVGGQCMSTTINGFVDLAKNFNLEVPIFVIWINDYFGNVQTLEYESFEEFTAYKEHANKIAAVIRFPDRPQPGFRLDLSRVMTARRTFANVLDNKDKWGLMTWNRMKLWWKDMCSELDDKLALLVDETGKSVSEVRCI